MNNLTFITGPVGSGKTTYLSKLISSLIYDNITKSSNIVYVVPEMSIRPDKVRKTKLPKGIKILRTDKSLPMISLIDYQYIFIDEIQFYDNMTNSVISTLLGIGKQITVAGITNDYHALPFNHTIGELLAISDDIIKLHGICNYCCRDSSLSILDVLDNDFPSDGNIIVESDKVRYIPVCRECYNKYTDPITHKLSKNIK